MALSLPSSANAAGRLYRKGREAYEADQYERARELWEQALARDPGLADALLGLHALGEGGPDILARLAEHADRLGEHQQGRRFRSWYAPIGFQAVPLSDADDVRLARARELAVGDGFADALSLCERCSKANPLVDGVRARIEFTRGDYDAAVRHAQRAVGRPRIESDVQLLLGMSYAQLGLHELAFAAFELSVASAESKAGRLSGLYNLAATLESVGRAAEARRLYEGIYAEDAGYLDVAEILQEGQARVRAAPRARPAPSAPKPAASPAPTTPAPETPAEPGWDDFIGELDD